MSVVANDLHKFRKLVLYMMITMDINYGQMKIGGDSQGANTYLKY